MCPAECNIPMAFNDGSSAWTSARQRVTQSWVATEWFNLANMLTAPSAAEMEASFTEGDMNLTSQDAQPSAQ